MQIVLAVLKCPLYFIATKCCYMIRLITYDNEDSKRLRINNNKLTQFTIKTLFDTPDCTAYQKVKSANRAERILIGMTSSFNLFNLII